MNFSPINSKKGKKKVKPLKNLLLPYTFNHFETTKYSYEKKQNDPFSSQKDYFQPFKTTSNIMSKFPNKTNFKFSSYHDLPKKENSYFYETNIKELTSKDFKNSANSTKQSKDKENINSIMKNIELDDDFIEKKVLRKKTDQFLDYLKFLSNNQLYENTVKTVSKAHEVPLYEEYNIYNSSIDRKSIIKDSVERLYNGRRSSIFAQEGLNINGKKSIRPSLMLQHKRYSSQQQYQSIVNPEIQTPYLRKTFYISEKDKFYTNQMGLIDEIILNIKLMNKYKNEKTVSKLLYDMVFFNPKLSDYFLNKDRVPILPITPKSLYSKIILKNTRNQKILIAQSCIPKKHFQDLDKFVKNEDYKNIIIENGHCKIDINTIGILVHFKNRLQELNINLEKESFDLVKKSLLNQHHEILEKEMKMMEKRQKNTNLVGGQKNKQIYHMMKNELKNRFKLNTTVLSSDLGMRIEKCEEKFGNFDKITAISKMGLNNLENTIYTIKNNQYDLNEEIE